MDENRQPRRANLLRISIRTMLIVTVVVAAYFAGRIASKDEVAKLKLQVAQSRALADHAFDQLNAYRDELEKPSIEHVMQGDANTWPDQLRDRLPTAPEKMVR